MKRTQRIDARMNVRKQIVSFLSIIVIAAMAVTAYLGLNFSSRAIADNGNDYYDSMRFRDAEVVSTLLLSGDDLTVLRSTEGVADLEAVWQTSGALVTDGQKKNVTVLSLTQRINVPDLLSGRTPETENECIVDWEVAEDLSLTEGDTIRIADAKYLKTETFTVCGVAKSVDYACNEFSIPGDRNVTVLPSAFDLDALDGCCMKALLRLDGTEDLNRFDSDYFEAIEPTVLRLKNLSGTREDTRTETIRTTYGQQIADGESQLEDAREQLSDARTQLDDGWAEYEDGQASADEAKAQLEEAKRQLDEAKEQLEEGQRQLDEAAAQLEEARQELAAGEAALYAGRVELEEGYEQLEQAKEAVRTALKDTMTDLLGPNIANLINWAQGDSSVDVDDPNATAVILPVTQELTLDLSGSLTGNIAALLSRLTNRSVTEQQLRMAAERVLGVIEQLPGETFIHALARRIVAFYTDLNGKYETLAAYAREWDEGHEQYLEAKDKLALGYSQYAQGLEQYYAAKEELEDGWRRYREGLKEYEDGLQAYEDGLKELSDGKQQLDDGEKQYADGLEAAQEGEKKLSDAKRQLDEVNPCRWVILDVNGNASYQMIAGAVKNVSDMGMTFALIFILVGALVIYATIGRIVAEQRRLVGATKALGLYKREILAKYLVFGVGATIIGMILGVVIGYFFVEPILTVNYGRYYNYENSGRAFLTGKTLLVAVCAAALAALAVWSACTELLRTPATGLMQEKAPSSKQKAGRFTKGLSLYARLILLNIRTDKKRVAVTIVSVAGCCTMLVTGFTMRYAILKTIDRQYEDVLHYDYLAVFSQTEGEEAAARVQSSLEREGAQVLAIRNTTQLYSINGNLSAGVLLCGDLEKMQPYYARNDTETGEKLPSDASGLWIGRKTAEMNGLSPGDTLTLYDGNMQPYTVAVAGVFENYIGREVLMSEQSYAEIFGSAPQHNALVVLRGGAQEERLTELLSGAEGLESLEISSIKIGEYFALASSLDMIAILMIAIAGIMACFILLNLISMHVNQKKRELTIMRVNGFTVREVIAYIARETVVTNIVGILLGLCLGMLLSARVIYLLEGGASHFIRTPQPMALLLSVLITAGFSFILNAIALRKVKTLKLTDVA